MFCGSAWLCCLLLCFPLLTCSNFWWTLSCLEIWSNTGCLPFTRKTRLVDSCSKWDASNPKWKFPPGCACFISKTFSQKIRSKAIQAKRPGPRKNWQMERTFSIRTFRLGILVYLLGNPVFPRKFPFRETKLTFPFTFHPKFPDFFE